MIRKYPANRAPARKLSRRHMHPGLRFAILKAGELSGCLPQHRYLKGKAWLAQGLGIKVQSINQWIRIPKNRVMMVSRLTGLSLEKLEPALFGRQSRRDRVAERNRRLAREAKHGSGTV